MKKNKKCIKYTVLQTVYKNDKNEWLVESIESMLKQTIKPSEYLILVDGPISDEIKLTLESYKKKNSIFKIVYYEENRGLGPVLADGVKMSKFEYISRMDSDDVAFFDRIEKELNVFVNNQDVDVVGGSVLEFIETKENIVDEKRMPQTNDEIYKYSRKRNPINHPTVMFKKNAVLDCGNYAKCDFCEDYDLWARMIKNGKKFYNIDSPVLYMRVNNMFYRRRGGVKYMTRVLKFKKRLYNDDFYSLKDFIFSSTASIIVTLSPTFLRKILYRRVLRKKQR